MRDFDTTKNNNNILGYFDMLEKDTKRAMVLYRILFTLDASNLTQAL